MFWKHQLCMNEIMLLPTPATNNSLHLSKKIFELLPSNSFVPTTMLDPGDSTLNKIDILLSLACLHLPRDHAKVVFFFSFFLDFPQGVQQLNEII